MFESEIPEVIIELMKTFPNEKSVQVSQGSSLFNRYISEMNNLICLRK